MRARAAAGEPLTYRARLRAALDAEPEATPQEAWAEMRAELERLVPGRGPLRQRLSDWDARWAVPPERLPAVVEAAIPWLRDAVGVSLAPFRLPDGEAVQSHVVTGARSAGYAEFLGGLRTRIDISADLPRQLPELVDTLAHETYTGHHLDFVAREARRVEEQGWLEASVLLADTPEAYLAEGLAIVGTRLLLPPEMLALAYRRLAGLVGLAQLDEEADLAARIQAVRERGIAAGADAALRINEEASSPEEVVEWLIEEVLLDPARARARVANAAGLDAALLGYAGGARLIAAWCGLEGPARAVPRFVRLLGATTTPSLLAADLAPAADPAAEGTAIASPAGREAGPPLIAPRARRRRR